MSHFSEFYQPSASTSYKHRRVFHLRTPFGIPCPRRNEEVKKSQHLMKPSRRASSRIEKVTPSHFSGLYWKLLCGYSSLIFKFECGDESVFPLIYPTNKKLVAVLAKVLHGPRAVTPRQPRRVTCWKPFFLQTTQPLWH